MLSLILSIAVASVLSAAATALYARHRYRALQWQLADTALQFQMVLDNMVEGMVVIDHNRNIVLMNRIGSDLISVKGKQMSYALVEEQFDAFTPEGDPLPFDRWPSSRALRGDFVQNFRIHHRNRITGETGARIMSTAPVPGPRGEAGQVIICYRDDTERRRIDEARTSLAAIVESSDDAIVSTTPTGIITSWNRGAEKITGFTAADMIGESVTLLLPSGDQRRTDEVFECVRRGETIERFDVPRKTRDDGLRRVDMVISPIRNSSGEVIGASIISRDITNTRNLERQLQQAQKMEAIGQLTGGIAHDFNNLLGIVSGNLDLLEGLLGGNEAALKRTASARKAASRAADLTRRLLAFSSKEILNPIATDLEHSVRNALEIAIHALGPEISISVNIAPKLQAVFIDPSGLESSLLNLFVNARDAMPQGGALHVTTKSITVDHTHPHVTNRRLAAGSYALVSVSDNGHGMSKETLERVFEPFFTTKERGRGTGLGLPMVYGFARQSKGHVQIYSEPGHGTTVSLYLPFATASSEKLTEALLQKPIRIGGKVLLVDDEIELLDISSAFLNKLGYETLIAQDATRALRLVAEHPDIDVIITDIIMPGGMNGVDLVHAVAQTHPEIKSLYTSGFPADALAEKNFAVSDHLLLNKPYRLAELGDAVARVMSEEPTPALTR